MLNLNKFIQPPKGYVSPEQKAYRKSEKKYYVKKIILHTQGMALIGILANPLELLGAMQRASKILTRMFLTTSKIF
jgi:hypothetical protein